MAMQCGQLGPFADYENFLTEWNLWYFSKICWSCGGGAGERYLAHNTANGNPSGCRYQNQNKFKAP